ncbi:hypothetical protein LCGC14_1132410 [marine sediment metagenome]|uniref:Uncharacterized protein n=1 Tax=marine sediment metagenome TaxID=412755 RepID=A0A0F9M5M6_9ZZZZ
MDKEDIKTIQEISEHVCPACGLDSDCGETPEDCYRIHAVVDILKERGNK